MLSQKKLKYHLFLLLSLHKVLSNQQEHKSAMKTKVTNDVFVQRSYTRL